MEPDKPAGKPVAVQYEFSEEENKFFKKAGKSMSLAGACKLFLGLLICIFFTFSAMDTWKVQKNVKLKDAVTMNPESPLTKELNKEIDEFNKQVGNMFSWLDRLLYFQIFMAIAGLAFAAIGSGCLKTAKAFSKIVTTQGNDISLLMEALHSIGKLYVIKCLFLLPIVVFVIMLLANIIIKRWQMPA